MKAIQLIFLFILYSAACCAQTTIYYYDWHWKRCEPPVVRYATFVERVDSGWKRTDVFVATQKAQMKGFYKDSLFKIPHGRFTWYYANGQLEKTGVYNNGNRTGCWYSFHSNGMMSDSIMYAEDGTRGNSLGWYPNGMLADSVAAMGNGQSVHVGWFDNGNLSYAGMYEYKKKIRKWKYYHINGQLAAEEWYTDGALTNKQYYNEDGSPQPDTTNRDRDADFKTGMQSWFNYIRQKASFPFSYVITEGRQATVVVAATIDEEGNMTDVYVEAPVHRAFDYELTNAIKKSPKWQPAIRHNRRVKFKIHQPLTFSMKEE